MHSIKFKPYQYQKFCIKKIEENEAIGLLLDMGLGKTVISLTATQNMLNKKIVKKPLVIAPKKVAESVWTDEVEKWEHLNGLKISRVVGDVKQRKAALKVKADLYIIGRDNIVWLVTHYGANWPFDMVIIDELSSFKNHKSKRFIAMRLVRNYIKRVVGLTGTPTSNGLLDLWSQVYLLDKGQRLYEHFNDYRDEFFEPGQRDGYTVFNYRLKTGGKELRKILGRGWYEKEIFERIEDICFSMKASDYLDMPPLIDNVQTFDLSPKVQAKYNQFERDLVLELITEQLMTKEISPANAAGMTNKLLQFASGSVYDELKQAHFVHPEKLEKLDEVLEALNGRRALLFYGFNFSLTAILRRYKGARQLKTPQDIKDWNLGRIPLLVAHPMSAGHGLNLQFGGNDVVWFENPWSLELNQQGLTRVFRNGVTGPVTQTRLVARRTMDEDVLASLADKDEVQAALIKAVRARIEKYNF